MIKNFFSGLIAWFCDGGVRAWLPSKTWVVCLLAVSCVLLTIRLRVEVIAHRNTARACHQMVNHVKEADYRVEQADVRLQQVLQQANDDIEAMRAALPKKYPVKKPTRTYVSIDE